MNRTERNISNYVGTVYTSTDGKDFIVIDYRSHNDVTIQFLVSGYTCITSMYRVLNGLVTSPFKKSPVAFEDPEKQWVGCKYNIDGLIYEIVGYIKYSDVLYTVHDGRNYIGHASIGSLQVGSVKYPYKLNRCGCFLGPDKTYLGHDYIWVLRKWHALCDRATGVASIYASGSTMPRSTIKSRMWDGWREYGIFARWFISTISQLNPNYQYDIDKDVMYHFYKDQTCGYKLYSPATAELIPHMLNIIIHDPTEKRQLSIRKKIVDLAEKYHNDNALSDRAYTAIQIVYNGAPNTIGMVDVTTNGYNIFAPRLDNFLEFYTQEEIDGYNEAELID